MRFLDAEVRLHKKVFMLIILEVHDKGCYYNNSDSP